MSREKTRVSLARKIIGAILPMQVVVMTCLSIMVVYGITQNVRTTATDNLQTIVQERSQIVENYVQESEVILSAYSKAGEILNVLKNPENKSAVDAAQKYTESFSGEGKRRCLLSPCPAESFCPSEYKWKRSAQ